MFQFHPDFRNVSASIRSSITQSRFCSLTRVPLAGFFNKNKSERLEAAKGKTPRAAAVNVNRWRSATMCVRVCVHTLD